MNKYYKKIESYLMNRPQEWIKIDKIKIELLAPQGSESFHRAWQDLVACGRVEISGNSLRINQ